MSFLKGLIKSIVDFRKHYLIGSSVSLLFSFLDMYLASPFEKNLLSAIFVPHVVFWFVFLLPSKQLQISRKYKPSDFGFSLFRSYAGLLSFMSILITIGGTLLFLRTVIAYLSSTDNFNGSASVGIALILGSSCYRLYSSYSDTNRLY